MKHPPNINPENPIVQLDNYVVRWDIRYPILENTQPKYIEWIKRLFWTHYAATIPSTLMRISAPVLVQEFQVRFNEIINYKSKYLDQLRDDKTRHKRWSLETDWRMNDDALCTDHHLIPQDRGWIDNQRNYLKLPEDVHQEFHRILSTFTPIEQIAHLILLLRGQYNIEFITTISEQIKDQNDHYIHNLIKWWKLVYPKSIWGFIRNMS